jgi:LacI family transcriptional regulator
VATASRALNGSVGVSPATMSVVLTASRELGYRPDRIARAMRSGTTGLIGAIVPGVSNPFFAEVVEALDNALTVERLDMVLVNSGEQVDVERRRVDTLLQHKVDGLIVIAAGRAESAPALREAQARLPVVQVDREIDGVVGDYVGVDNRQGIRSVLDHVSDCGAERVAFVSSHPVSSTGQSRLASFVTEAAHLPHLSVAPPELGDFTLEFGREAAQRLLAADPRPDTIVCGADIIALGVLNVLRENGVSVPGEIMVTGFDGILLSALSDPPLTTVRQPVETIAAEAVRLCLDRLAGDTSPARRYLIAPDLWVRRSTR